MKKSDLNRFNVGKSHKENKYGGIPLGMGPNGKPNTVQQEETSKGDFIFSNDITLTKDVIKQFNLPTSLEGKTVAKATKYIDDKFKDRNDKISTSTKTKMLDGIASAQEAIKAKQMQLSQALEANSTEVPDMMNGQVPEGFEEFLPQNKMFLGGFGGNALQGAGAVGNAMGQGNFSDRYNYDPKLKAQYEQMEGVKDGIAGAFGPYGQIFRGIEKGGKALGTSIGGETGGDIASGILDPLSGQMETFNNSKSTGFEKAAVVAAPFLSGVIGSMGRKRVMRDNAAKQHILGTQTYQNDFALGGGLNDPKYIPTIEDEFMLRNYVPQINNSITIPQSQLDNPGFNIESSYNTDYKSPFSKTSLKPVANWLGNNYGDIMRYAPVATNLLQLNKLKRPGYERLNRLDNRYRPEYVDERSIQNIAGNELDNVSNSLTGAVNGSTGILRNSLLGASLNRTKALSDAYLNASAQNRQQNSIAQQFNAGIDQTNLQQANQELDINDRNRAAYDNNKSRLISEIGNNIGDIGREEVYKKIARNTYGYKWDGRYWIKPDGSTVTDAEVKNEISNSTNSNKLGGMLLKKKK